MIKKSVLLTALAIAGFAVTSLAQTVPNYVPTNGLVGWWPFNGNAIDESSNTNNGTVNGATLTADRFGNANSAYSFNGNGNYITVIDNATLRFSSHTISLWYYRVNNPLTQANPCGNNGVEFLISKGQDIATNSFEMYQSNSLGQSYNLIIPEIQTTYNLGVWTNIIGTYDSTLELQKFYINGLLISSKNNIIWDCFSNNSELTFGVHSEFLSTTCTYFYKGKLDDIGIWNRALTQQEITGLYNGNLCFQTITVTDTLLINTNLTGFNPVTYQNTIKIWPNPTNDHITIDNGNLANLTGHQIKISNALGQQVFQSAITQQQFYVDMSTWGGNGIYFVNLINAQGVTIETRKIVLQ